MEQFLSNQNGELQMQILKIPSETNIKLRQENLDIYLGIAHGISDPFNFFINITDIEEKRDLIYFFSYSMGKKKTVVWGTYNVKKDKIKIESGCRYDSWKYIDYINMWKEMNYRIYDVIFENKFTKTINKFLDKQLSPKNINNEYDLRAWKYMLAYFDNNISEEDFIFLFDRIDTSQLSYYYENYINGESPILDFYELFNITDFTEQEDLNNIIDEINNKINHYENNINYINNDAPKQIRDTVMRITRLFLDNIMRSKYVGDESVKGLPICPRSIKECDPDDLEDEQNKCSVFSYGRSSFHKNDNRYGYVMYEDDLT